MPNLDHAGGRAMRVVDLRACFWIGSGNAVNNEPVLVAPAFQLNPDLPIAIRAFLHRVG